MRMVQNEHPLLVHSFMTVKGGETPQIYCLMAKHRSLQRHRILVCISWRDIVLHARHSYSLLEAEYASY
jgi:hypothetical protein